MRLQRSKAELMDTLLKAAGQASPGRADFAALVELPSPVARYLMHVLRDGQPLIRIARLRQTGKLRADTRNRRWLPFEARQIVAPVSVGFIWDARVTIVPPLHVRVLDAYVLGNGSGHVSLLSAIPLASDSGSLELNSGALHRYLAESVWYPTALLPSKALHWSHIDGNRALATLSDAGQTVSLEFRFNEAGEVSGVYSPGRWQKVKGNFRQTPWEGRFRSYREVEGMVVPAAGEVGWYANGQWQMVWSGNIVEAAYEFVE